MYEFSLINHTHINYLCNIVKEEMFINSFHLVPVFTRVERECESDPWRRGQAT